MRVLLVAVMLALAACGSPAQVHVDIGGNSVERDLRRMERQQRIDRMLLENEMRRIDQQQRIRERGSVRDRMKW